jgi:hypothetical protein
MEESLERQYCIGRKLHKNLEAAKVSGQQTNYLLSKPQQVYSSVGIEDQTITAVPAHSTNGRGVWEWRVKRWGGLANREETGITLRRDRDYDRQGEF